MAPRARFPAVVTCLHICESTSLPVCPPGCKSPTSTPHPPSKARGIPGPALPILGALEQEESSKIILPRPFFQVHRRRKRTAVLSSHHCWAFGGHPPSSAANPSACRCQELCSGFSGSGDLPKPKSWSRANQTWESHVALHRSPTLPPSNPLLMEWPATYPPSGPSGTD